MGLNQRARSRKLVSLTGRLKGALGAIDFGSRIDSSNHSVNKNGTLGTLVNME